ncbi:hypothetical protein L1887_55050 [Cichorium endivia]|nr:hypothetical protein L1887_55050 [Cichorium endivia]
MSICRAADAGAGAGAGSDGSGALASSLMCRLVIAIWSECWMCRWLSVQVRELEFGMAFFVRKCCDLRQGSWTAAASELQSFRGETIQGGALAGCGCDGCEEGERGREDEPELEHVVWMRRESRRTSRNEANVRGTSVSVSVEKAP